MCCMKLSPIILTVASCVAACSSTNTTDSGPLAPDGGDVLLVDTFSPTDSPSIPDVPNVPADSGVCPTGTMSCPLVGCVDVQSNLSHCGACANACPMVVNGTAMCTAGVCRPTCNMGFEVLGASCVAPNSAPRQVAPLSLGDVSLRRPTLRWQLPAGMDGAEVQLCRDRACTMVLETRRVMGTSVYPMVALAPSSVVYWRLRGTAGMATGMTYSKTWLFHVPARDNSGGIDTSTSPHLDLNGDGFDDMVVGATGATARGASTGQVSVFYGSARGLSMAPTLIIEGAAAADYFGWAVAGAGDVDGDGFGDVLVSAIFADPVGRRDAGAVSIYHGSPTGINMPARVLEGGAANERFGQSVASAGDVNGDGYADVMVSSPLASPGGRMLAGSVQVYHGSAAGIPAVATRVIEGQTAGNPLGNTVAGAGDVNGDGFSDIVLGSPNEDPGGRMDSGIAILYHGGMMGLSMAPSRVIEGVAIGDQLGHFVAGAGDVNGDGYSDVLLSAPVASAGAMVNVGTVGVYSGSATGLVMGAPARLIGGLDRGDAFGTPAVGAGDLNGDGFGDIVIGAFNADPGGRVNAGTATVFHGSAMGIPMAAARVLEGQFEQILFGGALAGARDVNGDGFGDLLVGAYRLAPRGVVQAGGVSVFHGSAVGVGVMPTIGLEGGAAQQSFGFSIARAERVHQRRTVGARRCGLRTAGRMRICSQG